MPQATNPLGRSHLEKARFSLSMAAEFAPRSVECHFSHPTHLSYPWPSRLPYLTQTNSLGMITSMSLRLPDLDPVELFSSPYMTLSVSCCKRRTTASIPQLSPLLYWASISKTYCLRIDEWLPRSSEAQIVSCKPLYYMAVRNRWTMFHTKPSFLDLRH